MTMNKKLQVNLKNDLVITSLDGEGLLLDLDTRKIFWINETAAFLLRLFETNGDGIPLSTTRSLLQKQYLINGRNKMSQDLASFINYLEWYGLVSLRPASNGNKTNSPDYGERKLYLKPIIEEEMGMLSIIVAKVRASRKAAVRQQASRQAAQSGFRAKA